MTFSSVIKMFHGQLCQGKNAKKKEDVLICTTGLVEPAARGLPSPHSVTALFLRLVTWAGSEGEVVV